MIWISCNWLNNFIHTFWMCCQVYNAFYQSGLKWWNYDLPYSADFVPLPLWDHTWEHSDPSRYSFWKLQCWGVPVSPACCNSFSVIVATKWSMTWVPICTGALSPYLSSEMIRNNTSSLYGHKSGIVRLDPMYPLYGIKMLPSPQDATHPYQFPQWKDP